VVLTVVLSIVLSIFSTVVMSYISMATPMGPWIAPTLVIAGMSFLSLVRRYTDISEPIVLSVSAGSVGGILATACGFAFPTLHFLNADLFGSWLQQPALFMAILGSLSFLAGWLGLWLANYFEYALIVRDDLPFPVGSMIHKVIVSRKEQEQNGTFKKFYDLFAGFWATITFCALQRGTSFFRALIPKAVTLLPAFSVGVVQVPAIVLSLMPMLWAIGFVTGLSMVISLVAGSIAKIMIVEPLHQLFFSGIDSGEFMLAFHSGMVVAGALYSFIRLPKMVATGVNGVRKTSIKAFLDDLSLKISRKQVIECCMLLLFTSIFLYSFNFGIIAQAYLVFFAAVCAYQITLIAGKIGLAQLGRFATFVMIPGLFLFKFNYVQTVIVATFVEVCGGVMADILFGRKLAYLSDISREKVRKYQYFGLIISSLVVGVVFWLLLSHFQLGGADLFAQRAQARSLLIQAQHFNFYVLWVGILFGFILRFTPFNPMLVFGGLLMPINLTLGFAGGALMTLLVNNRQEWIPFWSGVFAANSIWMVLQAFLRYVL